MGFPPKDCCWLTTLVDKVWFPPIVVDAVEIPRVAGEVGFKALGCWITGEGRETAEVRWREQCYWTTFYRFLPTLRNQYIPIANRSLLLQNVFNSSFWCAGSWNLTADQLRHIRRVQQKSMGKVVRVARGAHELEDFYLERRSRISKGPPVGKRPWPLGRSCARESVCVGWQCCQISNDRSRPSQLETLALEELLQCLLGSGEKT